MTEQQMPKRTNYPPDMDLECIRICDWLNAQAGLRTTASCCGHGEQYFRVFFLADTISALRVIAEPLSMGSPWLLRVGWANGNDVIYFVLEGPREAAAGDLLAEWLENGDD